MNYLYLFLILLFPFQLFAQNVKIKEKKGKYGLVMGGKKLTEFIYDTIQSRDQYYLVNQEDKWGILDPYSDEVPKLKYDTIFNNLDNGFIAHLSDKAGVIDNKENLILDFVYDKVDHYRADGSGLVKHNGKWAILKNDSLDYSIEDAMFCNPELKPVMLSENNGNQLLKPEYRKKQKFYSRAYLEKIYGDIKYPSISRENGDQGKVVIEMVIDKNGNLINPRVVESVTAEIDAEALRVIKLVDKWVPAYNEGKPVNFLVQVPVNFRLL